MNSSLLISLLSVIIAAIALYNTHFRPAKIKIFAAEWIAIWYLNGDIAFDIPLIFSNFGKKPGVIHSMAILFFNPQNKEDNFYLKWLWFLKFIPKTQSWEQDEIPFPIAIEPAGTISKCINFLSPDCKKNWSPKPGDYKITVFGWSKKRSKPNIKDEFSIHIDETKSEYIKGSLMSNQRKSNYIFRDDYGIKKSKNLTKDELNNIIKY